MAEWGGDVAALVYAIELRSWTVQPDPGQQDLLDSGLTHLRQDGIKQPALIGAALGLRNWIGRDSSQAALPYFRLKVGLRSVAKQLR